MADPDAPPRVFRMTGSRRGGRVTRRLAVPDVTHRLASLERQVEEALAGAGRSARLVPPLETLVYGLLDAYGRVRRAVSGEREAAAELIAAPIDLLSRWWWRVDVIGIERLPARGPVLVAANRAGALLPYEAFVLARSLGRAPDGSERATRVAHPVVDAWLLELPLAGTIASTLGAVPATADALRRALAGGDIAVTFPEGPDSIAKPVGRRYRLAPFGRAALLRVAVESAAPIVPVAVIGAEEAQPVFWRSERLGRLLGLPALPVPPAIVPLPTKWTIHVGEPLDPPPRGSRDRRLIRGLSARLRERLQGLVSDAVNRRRGLFV
jgi:1-acyl-sn-glycerol-3-phosphate acyltransferase